MGVIQDELQELRKLCERVIPDSKLVSCVESLVRVEIRKSKVKTVIICLQFPSEYPNCPVLIELKSKFLSDQFLNKLTQACETEVKKLIGKPQILKTLKFIENFFTDYPLASCYDEINDIKKALSECDSIKLNQKASHISLTVIQDKYFVHSKLIVPQNYPDNCVDIEIETNFPGVLSRYISGQSKEISRQCIQPPLNLKKKQNFIVKPSLLLIANFIISSTKHFSKQICPICNKSCLPADPQNLVVDESSDYHVERVYCGHLYHLICLLNYLKTPPFKGGKKCPLCSEKIHHDKWKVGDKLAEDRWAHKQARERELQEVVDFLS